MLLYSPSISLGTFEGSTLVEGDEVCRSEITCRCKDAQKTWQKPDLDPVIDKFM
jgi:hypothetical protein